MKNILKIIGADIRRLTKNVVAVVVIMGLSVIPSLYAWFNILSNWDPYGPEATSNLQVAVASEDVGLTIGNYELNVGNLIIQNLQENHTIGWVFTDTADEAVQGVYSGDYYAALVIDESFSENLVSFISGDIENPHIIYYENDKKNAIAPKITGKVKTTIQNSVNQAFVSTLTETLMSTSEMLVQTDEEGNFTGAALDRLKSLDSDMKAVILILDSYLALMDSTESLMAAGETVSNSVDAMLQSAETMAESTESAVDTARGSAETMGNVLDSSFRALNTSLDSLYKSVDDMQKQVTGGVEKAETAIAAVQAMVPEVQEQKDEINGLVLSSIPQEELEKYEARKAELNTSFESLNSDLEKLKAQNATNTEDVVAIAESILKDIDNCKTSVENLHAEYNNSVAPQMKNAMNSVDKSIREIERMLNFNAANIDAVAKSLGNYPAMMGQSRDTLQKSRAEAVAMEIRLSKLIADVEGLNSNAQYQKFLELAKNDPAVLADFISSPVKVHEEYVYPVENNGSMTAPFYMVLSIWVGALIMSTILKTEVKDKSELSDVKNWQCFFGRYFITFLIGQIQVLITVLGALFFVNIQCQHPLLLLLACSWTAFVYSLLLYSFTYSFGNVGEALSVILMVIQVAGAGGTFPIEVLPKVFQVLYKFMPFNYSMNAVRECIGGMYQNNYWKYLLILLVYVAVACVNGLLLYKPCKILNHQIEKSKEKSGILI